jgi:hypothetical protein
MAERIKFATPQAIVFRGAELDGPVTVDPDTGTVSGTFSLLREDGKRTVILEGVDVALAGTIEAVQGEPINVVAPR